MMALKISEEQKKKLKLGVTIIANPDIFLRAMEVQRREDKLAVMLAKDQNYNKEIGEAMKKIREKYAQKYMDEGLL